MKLPVGQAPGAKENLEPEKDWERGLSSVNSVQYIIQVSEYIVYTCT